MKNVDDIYPLTPMQQGMLFHTLLAPESGIYVEQLRFTLKGSLNAAALKQAMQMVLERHTILRTAFIGEGLKEPVQVVYHQVKLNWREEDWSTLPPEEQERCLDDFLARDRAAGFTLSQPPLFRTTLIRTAVDTCCFVFTNHHILMDGWSVPILLGEVFALYDACAKSQTPALPAPHAFREYVRWLQKQDQARAQAYWQDTLRGFGAPTPLVCTHPEPAKKDAPESWGDEEYYLPVDLTASLQALSRKLQVTLSSLVSAAWALLLGRYSGEPDVVFGMTVSGRPPELPGSEDMIGLFINTLPVRVNLDPAQTVTDWLKKLQAGQVEMHQYEYSSLVQIKQWSEVSPSQPLFETLLVFENYPVDAALKNVEQDLVIQGVRSHEQTHFPLALIAGPGERLFLRLIYETPRFSPTAAHFMLAHLEALLAGMAAQPDAPLRNLSLLTAGERRQILDEWNNTAAPYPDSICIHQWFEQVAAAQPDAPALTFKDTTLTYSELNQHANALANRLINLGVRTENVVGVCLDRSLELIVAILGVLKAGGAYLPLDPSYPAERIQFILADSGVKTIITRPQLAELAGGSGASLVLLEQNDAPTPAAAENPPCTSAPDKLAYIIYTSGSTGKPKGALLRHRGLVNFSQANARCTESGPGTRFLQFASLSFDASLSEIFNALVSGSCLVMVPQEITLSPEGVQKLLQDQHVTTAILPPSLLEYLDPDALPELRVLVSAGEKCPLELAQRWTREHTLWNGYGPTEVTIGPTMYLVPKDLTGFTTIPVGKPIENAQVYILDRDQQLLPVGIPGEICVGGVGLAIGYHNRPELTAARFVPNPYASEPGARMYRTGDLGRYLPDGNIEYLGRLDHQVKIHGFRIELEEIEAALSSHPAVRQAAVVVHGEGASQRLIAYYVPAADQNPLPTDLRSHLSSHLPHFMLPSSYVSLEALPLSPNGKIDRKALTALGQDPAGSPLRNFVAPRDTLEFQLAKIWEEVLGVSPIGVRDSFFELGGHSLLAVRITALVQKKLGKEIPVLSLFQDPTIEHMAGLLRQDTDQNRLRSLVEIQPAGQKRPIFFIHPSGGSVHWYFELAQALGPDQPFYGIQARGLNGDCEIDTLIPDMAAHYIEEIRSVQPEGPYQIGSWSMGVMIAYEIARQLQRQGQPVSLLALLDQGPILPGNAPADDAEYYLQTFGKQVPLDLDHLRTLDGAAQVDYVLAEAKRVGWVINDVTPDQFGHFVRMLRTHTEAWRQYQALPYSGPVTLFRAAVQENPSAARDLGWNALVDQLEVIDVPGDHLTMVHHPEVEVLAQKIKECLDRVPA